MIKLSLGILLWSFAHFIPAAAVDFRKNLISKLGEGPYKGIFALLIVLSIYLIISGWKSTVPEMVYLPPLWGHRIATLLVLIGFILFIASIPPTLNIKRFIRHPQLTGVACWGVGHLLANGELRSIVLFGGLAAWAIIEIILVNRRDGAWTRPEIAPIKMDIVVLVAGIAAYAISAFTHQWMFGVTPFV